MRALSLSRDQSSSHIELVQAVNEQRLWNRHLALSAFGARSDGGVNRQALSGEDAAAHAEVVRWSEAAGYRCTIDPIGNLFIRREGSDPTLPPILTGSHLDSQPAGGKFDGTYGVLAGLEALQALDEAGHKSKRAIEVVSWTNEEGSRFFPGMMGSSLFAGEKTLEEVVGIRDQAGITVADALSEFLDAMSWVPRRQLGFPLAAYIEAHIEQGPVLERTGSAIGAVTGVQGARWLEITVTGTVAHAGTTPLSMRRDALKTAVAIIADLHTRMADETDTLRCTVGRVVVEPNSPNTVPGNVSFSVDLRHPQAEVLNRLISEVRKSAQKFAGECSVVTREIMSMGPVEFDTKLVDLLEAAASKLSLPVMRLFSGAFHDAIVISRLCPSAMVFVPCAGGISHSPLESAKPGHLVAGARVLTVALAALSSE